MDVVADHMTVSSISSKPRTGIRRPIVLVSLSEYFAGIPTQPLVETPIQPAFKRPNSTHFSSENRIQENPMSDYLHASSPKHRREDEELMPEINSEAEKNPRLVQQVINALENPHYVWRTIQGVSRDTNISSDVVDLILRNLGETGQVVETSRRDFGLVYTTREHYRKKENAYNRVLSMLSGKIR